MDRVYEWLANYQSIYLPTVVLPNKIAFAISMSQRFGRRRSSILPLTATAATAAFFVWQLRNDTHNNNHHVVSGLMLIPFFPSSTNCRTGATRTTTTECEQQQVSDGTSHHLTGWDPSTTLDHSVKALRHGTTKADAYYRTYQRLPEPSIVHAVLPPPPMQHTNSNDANRDKSSKNILVIGDVHGCCDELVLLHQKAIEENDGLDFAHVILVGDLVNKGKQSVQVIRKIRQQQWWSVRGNHDDGALLAALGDATQRNKKTYQWVFGNDESNNTDAISDADVEFLSELPYTLRIPKEILDEEDADTLIVHAGLIPGLSLSEQSIETMVTLREVEENEGSFRYFYNDQKSNPNSPRYPWASVWVGPEKVIFGHDARRGLQQYKWAVGLDTGACYGKVLTGIILPQRKLVQVQALAVHCPIGGNKEE